MDHEFEKRRRTKWYNGHEFKKTPLKYHIIME